MKYEAAFTISAGLIGGQLSGSYPEYVGSTPTPAI